MNIVRVGSAVLLGAMLAACASPQEQKQSLQEAALAEGFTPVSAAELTGAVFRVQTAVKPMLEPTR